MSVRYDLIDKVIKDKKFRRLPNHAVLGYAIFLFAPVRFFLKYSISSLMILAYLGLVFLKSVRIASSLL